MIALSGQGPLGRQVFRALRQAIVDGTFPAGARLPSTRALAEELLVSRKVVVQAFAYLADEGYVEARVGSGTRVSESLPDALLAPWRASARTGRRAPVPPPRLSRRAEALLSLQPWPPPARPVRPHLPYDFHPGTPSLLDFPHDTWVRLLTRRARALSVPVLRYGPTLGFEALRQHVAEYVARARGVVASSDQVAIVNGTQQGLDIVARLLVAPGDRVVVEEPGYQAARQAFQAAGAEIVPVPVDAHGLQTDHLPAPRSVMLAYVTPSHHYPLGGILPLTRRLELLRWAERGDVHIVEDDYDSEFQYDHQPVQALQGLDRTGRVLYVGSFSKVLFPSLRIGYLIVPPPLIAPVASVRFLTDYQTPTFEQSVLADFIAGGHFERHLRRSRRRNHARRLALVSALHTHCRQAVEVVGANAGVHVMVWLRHVSITRLEALIEEAAESGVGLYAVTPYYLVRPKTAGLLLGYANLSEVDITEGIRLLGRLLRRSTRRAG